MPFNRVKSIVCLGNFKPSIWSWHTASCSASIALLVGAFSPGYYLYLKQAISSNINRNSLQCRERTAAGWKKSTGYREGKVVCGLVLMLYNLFCFMWVMAVLQFHPNAWGEVKVTFGIHIKKLMQGFGADFYLPVCEPVTQELQRALFFFF